MPDDLPYRIEQVNAREDCERVLARACNTTVANACFEAIAARHPELRLMLMEKTRIVRRSWEG